MLEEDAPFAELLDELKAPSDVGLDELAVALLVG